MGNISRVQRAQGSLIASAIGDALGWPYEFNSGNQNRDNTMDSKFVSWKRKNKYPFWYVETIKKGNYSDDTQLTLAIARSLLCKDWFNYFTKVEYPYWLTYERGAGRAVKKAALIWKKGNSPWISAECRDYFWAGGNGGAMRILPHVIRGMDNKVENVIDEVIQDVTISHGHPRAILGATCYAFALYYLFNKHGVLGFAELIDVLIDGRKIWGAAPNRDKFNEWLEIAKTRAGYNFPLEWNYCYSNIVKCLEYIKQSLSDGLLSDDRMVLENIGAYSKVSGAGDVAILVAIYFFSKYINTPELAISIPACSVGIDTDTIASMTGGLIGAFCGCDWIPLEWKAVQDYSYICSLANELYGTCELVETLKFDIRNNDILETIDIESKYSIVSINECKTPFGQTIFLKKIKKKIENKSDEEKEVPEIQISINLLQIEHILEDEKLCRITLRKAMNIVYLKYKGMKEDEIAKTLKIDNALVSSVLSYFK